MPYRTRYVSKGRAHAHITRLCTGAISGHFIIISEHFVITLGYCIIIPGLFGMASISYYVGLTLGRVLSGGYMMRLAGRGVIDPVYSAIRQRCFHNTLKSSKARKEKEEVKFKRPGSMNDDDIESDVIKHDSDVTIRDIEVNKPIARKRYAQKHSFVSKKGFLKSLSRVCSRTFTRVALMLAIVISILGGLFNIILPERKSTIGTSSSLSPSKPRVILRCHGYSALSILRESAAAIISISEELCSCIRKVIFLNDNQQLTRCMKVLQNTIDNTRSDYLQ